MNSAQINIVKQTVPILQEHGEMLTRRFYENMFSNNPEVKRFFNPAHQHSGTQQRALAGAICAYAANIDNPDALSGAVDLIAHKHVSLGIKPEHYPIVGSNLILTIKEVLGDAANDEVIEAWTAAYGQLVDIFVNHEKGLYQQQKAIHGWNGFKPFTVIKKIPESSNITSFYLRPDDDSDLESQKPGQYITLRLNIDGKPVMRNYSLSNAPGASAYRISVKREAGSNAQPPDGLVSNHLHDNLQVNDSIDLAPPSGDFALAIPDDNKVPMVFVAGGVGITPVIAMLHALLESENAASRSVYLFQCVRNLKVLPFTDELAALAERYANFHWQVHVSQQTAAEKNVLGNLHEGRLSQAALDKIVERQQPMMLHACGPAGLIKELSAMIKTRNQPQDTFRYEFFGPAQAV
ncbi:MAG TPA: NO-inducible flavohemoprotein [Methylotenera sp.]|nr:NO-inducible flavohemoprotein [Methylotenera sp.]